MPNRSLVAFLSVLVVSCQLTMSSTESKLRFDRTSQWEKAKWIEKASETIRRRTASAQEIRSLLDKPKDTIIENFFTDPGFGDSVLAFNLFFLGARQLALREYDRTWEKEIYAREVLAHPQAIRSAKETVTGGDFLSLLAGEQPTYVAPPSRSLALRLTQLEEFEAITSLVFDRFEPWPDDIDAACLFLRQQRLQRKVWHLFGRAGFRLGISRYFGDVFQATIRDQCRSHKDPHAAIENLRNALTTIKSMFALVNGLTPEDYPLDSVPEFRAFDEISPRFPLPNTNFTIDGFWSPQSNSSTNYNRRRSRYMLKTYFCDDLTPIEVPSSSDHIRDRHAADPGCRSCHFRLDPMAGFFRHYGRRGWKFTGRTIIFDDGATLGGPAYKEYRQNWRSDAPNRPWNVGVVQSPERDSINAYGSELEELVAMINGPVSGVEDEYQPYKLVRRCIARRMTEFVLGTEQIYDPAWTDELAGEFEKVPREQSAEAYKAIIKELVLSNTYSHPDPNENECYDRGSSGGNSNAPCAISHIVTKRCGGCHSGMDFDLTVWTKDPAGLGTFQDIDPNGNQRPQLDTLTTIHCRLANSNPDLVMPPGGAGMTTVERATVLSWIGETIGRVSCDDDL